MGSMMKLLCLLVIAAHSHALLKSPPRIVKQPTAEEQLFMVAQPGEADKPFIIECEAEGEPAPQYRWAKNGKPFNYTSYADRILQQPGRGTLVVTQPQDEDVGQYQCFAYNKWGTATSNSVFVRKAELDSFIDTDGEPKNIVAQEGRPFKLTCHPPNGFPKPKVVWMLQGDQGQMKTINNSRMTLDPEGNLWFSNVTRYDDSDYSTKFAYICVARSPFRNEYKLGNKVYLKVTWILQNGEITFPAEKLYTTKRGEVALRGKNVELYCIYGGTPLPQIVWKKDGQNILFSRRVAQSNFGKTLVIKAVQYEDKGTYTCEASNEAGPTESHSINLSIRAAPIFITEPEFQNLAEGETATIRCKADGSPEPQIKWVYNGEPIERAPHNPRRTISADSIEIVGLTKKDTGNYGCNATNSIGYVYKDVYINVQSIPPEIKEGPYNLMQVDGSEVVMRCRVSGAPRPSVKWMRDDVELTGAKFNITAEGDLVIRKVSFSDAGQYRCYAQNSFGEASAYGLLEVKKRTIIINKPADSEVAAGSTAVFRCTLDSDPDLTTAVTWEFKGKTIDIAREQRFIMTNDYSLFITNTTERDAGPYTCVGRSLFDEVRAQATLIVHAIPEIKKGPYNLMQVDGSEVVMRCRVSGAPRPSVKWMRDDVELTGGKFNITAKGDLVIRRVSFGDAGQYRCYAQNSFGEASAFGSLEVKKRTIIRNKPADSEVAAGSTAVFRCTVESDPDLTTAVTWEFKGETIDIAREQRFIMTNDYSLFITNTTERDAGPYTCVGRSLFDEVRAQATLTVKARSF